MTSDAYPKTYDYDDGSGNTCQVEIRETESGYQARCVGREGLTASGATPEAALDQWASNHGEKIADWGSPPSRHDPADAPGTFTETTT